MVRFPHNLTIPFEEIGAFNPETGNWEKGDKEEDFTTECRAHSSAPNAYITGEAGQRIDLPWTVELPRRVPKIPEGTRVQIINEDDEVIVNDTVKRFFRGQLHTQLWL